MTRGRDGEIKPLNALIVSRRDSKHQESQKQCRLIINPRAAPMFNPLSTNKSLDNAKRVDGVDRVHVE